MVPAALLIAGSGPTDRNGNSALVPPAPGQAGTLQTLAEWLATDGVASLRYDKLGSGQTGLGPYAAHPDTIGLAVFTAEAAAALAFLADQPDVDRARLAVIGHSEGALFALLIAAGQAGSAPTVHALGLLEPLSRRPLDLVGAQIDALAPSAQKAGAITPAEQARASQTIARAVQSLRTNGTVPANLVGPWLASLPNNLRLGLESVLSPVNSRFLAEQDRYDPAQLGGQLPEHMAVLVTCSDGDMNVSCTDVVTLVGGLAHATDIDFVRLTGVNHGLRQGTSYSGQVAQELRTFTSAHL